jgi:hypothetical protein
VWALSVVDSDSSVNQSKGSNVMNEGTYPSMEGAGLVEIEVPSLPGSRTPTETLHLVDLGRHMSERIEASLKPNPFPRSWPQQSPAKVMGHYIGTARGMKLLNTGAIAQLERLSAEFHAQAEKTRDAYFQKTIKPFLDGLKPERRNQ